MTKLIQLICGRPWLHETQFARMQRGIAEAKAMEQHLNQTAATGQAQAR